MKLLLDENLSLRLVGRLAEVFPGMEHVSSLALSGATDDVVWAYAKLHGHAIVSKDSDFFERSVLDPQPAKVIWIRIGNCSTDEIHALLLRQQAVIRKFLQEDSESCLLLTRGW